MSDLNTGATKALFDVKVERRSANLNIVLPFVMFGQNILQTGYQAAIPLPNSLELEVAQGTGSDLDKILFSYTDGTNTDVIAASSSTAPYPDALAATLTDLNRYDRIKILLSSNLDTAQFDERVNFLKSTMFGSREDNNIIPSSQISENQNQDRQVNLNVNNSIDAKRAILSKFRPQTGTISFNFFMYKVAVWNSSALSRL